MKTVNDIIHEALFQSLCDTIEAYRVESAGIPNTMLRDLAKLHANTVVDDLPEGVQKVLRTSVSDALRRLQREGYVVAPKDAVRSVRSSTPPPRRHR